MTTQEITGSPATPTPGSIVFFPNPNLVGFTYDEALAILSGQADEVINPSSMTGQMLGLTAASAPAAQHTGAMIALVPSSDDFIEMLQAIGKGAEPIEQLHCTLLFLGEASKIDPDVQDAILSYVEALAASQPIVLADVFGFNVWNPDSPETCVVAAVSGSDLEDVCMSVCEILDDADIEYPEQHMPWVPHVTLIYTPNPVDVLTDDLLSKTGPVTFDRLRVAFAGVNHDYPLGGLTASAQAFHLPGKHDQRTHGHGKGEGMRPVTVLDQHEWLARGRYQLSDDPNVRAGNVWAESYGGQQGVTSTMRNIHAGKSNPTSDVDENDPWLKSYASSENLSTNETYGMHRVKDDIMNAAVNLDDRLEHHSTKIDAPLHRGMRVKNAETRLKVGDTFDSDVSSWTTHEHIAKGYTRPQKGSARPEDGTPVLMRVHNARGIKLDDGSLYAQGGSGEHLLRGSFEVTHASHDGDMYVVDVRQT